MRQKEVAVDQKITFPRDVDRQVVLVILEDKDEEYPDADFLDLFNWVAGLEFVGSCWWIDSQAGDMKLDRFERQKQALSWLHCLVCDEIAGHLLQSHQVVGRTFPGAQPAIIGSVRTLELSLDRKELLAALFSIFLNNYFLHKGGFTAADDDSLQQIDYEIKNKFQF